MLSSDLLALATQYRRHRPSGRHAKKEGNMLGEIFRRQPRRVNDVWLLFVISFVVLFANGCKSRDNASPPETQAGAEKRAQSTRSEPNSRPGGSRGRLAIYGSVDGGQRPASGVPALIEKAGAKNVVPDLTRMLKAGTPWERIDAAEALREMGPESDVLKPAMIEGLAALLNDNHIRFEKSFPIDPRFNAAYALLRIERSHPTLIKWASELLQREHTAGFVPGDANSSWVPTEAANLLGKTASRKAVAALASHLTGPAAGLPKPRWRQFQWKNPASAGYALHYAGNGSAASIRALGALGQEAAYAVPQLQRLYNRLKNPKKQSDADVVTVIEVLDTISEIGEAGGSASAAILMDACATPDSGGYAGFDVDMLRLTSTKTLELFFAHWCQTNSAKLSKCPLWKVPRNYENFRIRLDLRKQEKACERPDRCVIALPD